MKINRTQVCGLAAIVLFASLAAGCSGSRPGGSTLADGTLGGCPESPNCVTSADADEEHAIDPIMLSGPGDWQKAVAALAELPGSEIVGKSDNYARAECTSRIFRWVDDVEILLADDGKTLHVRSASRTGYSDLGVNRKRIEALREAIN